MKRFSRKPALALACAALAACYAVSGCSTEQPLAEDASSGLGGDAPISIDVIQLSATSQINTAFANHVKEYAEAQGVACNVEYHENNVATEASMIENAITKGYDAIILQPMSSEDCVQEITKATEAGIATILYAEDVPDARYSYLFSEDAYAIGYKEGVMAGSWAVDNLVSKGDPVVACVGNASVSAIGRERNRGILDGLKDSCPEAEIAGVYDMAYKEEGLTTGENILQAHPDCNLVCGVNDQSVLGVFEAFKAAGRDQDSVGMFGIDGTDEALYYIKQGTMFKGVVDIDNAGVGEQIVDMAIRAAEGRAEGLEQKQYWAGQEITAANIDEYEERWGRFTPSAG